MDKESSAPGPGIPSDADLETRSLRPLPNEGSLYLISPFLEITVILVLEES